MFRDYTHIYSAECERCGGHVRDDQTLDDTNQCYRCQVELETEEASERAAYRMECEADARMVSQWEAGR